MPIVSPWINCLPQNILVYAFFHLRLMQLHLSVDKCPIWKYIRVSIILYDQRFTFYTTYTFFMRLIFFYATLIFYATLYSYTLLLTFGAKGTSCISRIWCISRKWANAKLILFWGKKLIKDKMLGGKYEIIPNIKSLV